MATRSRWPAFWAGLVAAVAYFVAYPRDLAAVAGPAGDLLAVSQSVAPGLYAVAAVALVCWTALRIWGRPPRPAAPDVAAARRENMPGAGEAVP